MASEAQAPPQRIALDDDGVTEVIRSGIKLLTSLGLKQGGLDPSALALKDALRALRIDQAAAEFDAAFSVKRATGADLIGADAGSRS